MKEAKLKRSMIAGIISGILLAHSLHANQNDKNKTDPTQKSSKNLIDLVSETNGNITEHLMTEDELLIQLNDEGARLYKSLSTEGKKLALSVASRSCNGLNECAGLNACASDQNKCAGQGSCRGKTKCAISDPNLAVKLVAKKLMAEKRLNTQNK